MAPPSGMVVMKVASCVVLIMCMVVISAPLQHAEAALSCGTVINSLQPCLGYLQRGGQVPAPCCNGVRSLNSAAQTTPDRQAACNCMKAASGQVRGVNMALAANLPKACGVNIPYKISPSTDCSKVK